MVLGFATTTSDKQKKVRDWSKKKVGKENDNKKLFCGSCLEFT